MKYVHDILFGLLWLFLFTGVCAIVDWLARFVIPGGLAKRRYLSHVTMSCVILLFAWWCGHVLSAIAFIILIYIIWPPWDEKAWPLNAPFVLSWNEKDESGDEKAWPEKGSFQSQEPNPNSLMRRLDRLNGWQRLWLVMVVLYAILVTVITVAFLPRESAFTERPTQWTFRTYLDEHKTGIMSLPTPIGDLSDLSDDDLKVLADAEHKHPEITASELLRQYRKHRIDLKQEYQKKLAELPYQQLKTVGYGFLAWVSPMAIIYGLGLAVGWIYRGFKKDNLVPPV